MRDESQKFKVLVAAGPLFVSILATLVLLVINEDCDAAIRQTTGDPNFPQDLYAGLISDCAVTAKAYLYAKTAFIASLIWATYFLFQPPKR
jgi:hypothetical protein